MLKEICITPQIFNVENINSNNWKDLKNMLENIGNSGYIVGLNNNDWKKLVRENINQLEPKIKDRFNSILNILNDRQRIVGHPKSNINPTNEDEWLLIVSELNIIRNFYSILATKPFSENSITLEQLEDININEKFGLTGSKHYLKTEEELEKIFLPLLSYAKKVIVIDPYFDISSKRYQETIKCIAQSFKEKRGKKDKGSIIINCSSKIVQSDNFKLWQKHIEKIFNEYKHIITINVWEQKSDSIKMHDRYIITDQSGISSAAGTDKDNYQQSEWAIKDYSSLNSILEQYKENSSPFSLKYIITSSSVCNKGN